MSVEIDIILLKLPNHNIDYPSLSIPTLTRALRNDGITVIQQDVNVELKDILLTQRCLEEITYEFLPAICEYFISDPEEYTRVKNMVIYLNNIDTTIGFGALESVKSQLLERKYKQIFTSTESSNNTLILFTIASLLHNVIDLAITLDELNAPIAQDNVVIRFMKDKIKSIAAINSRIVSFSVLDIQRKATLWFAKRLRKVYQGTIVVGGPDVSIFRDNFIRHYPFINVAFLKESEVSLVKFVQGVPVDTIDGVIYRDIDGTVRINEPKHEPSNSVYRPDFDGFPLDKFLLPTLPISASRGCKWAICKFCVHHQTYTSYYERTASAVVDDIEYFVQKYHTRYFHFTDDMLDITIGTAIARELIQRGLDINILTYARFQNGFTPEILDLWARGGIKVIEWGLESASPRMLKEMAKGISIEKVQTILKDSREKGILNKLMLFHNYPSETIDDFEQTVDFLEKNIEERNVRPFFTIRNKLELRLNSELDHLSQQANQTIFPKRWNTSSIFQSKIEYEDTPDYPVKLHKLEAFLGRMQHLVSSRRVFSTNDENLTLDLVVLDVSAQEDKMCIQSI
ncbi:radical SAM protein [Geobacter sp. SVR]|uniref:B12-binding domain-containing radical SAM protein n=1 Tax=Geobacter sp. SVR TaxID=2495594 RepID=UPI00143EFB0C|nr:radical SAM protein [Geobacter sp. SVR]BCS54413.1 hypothetical protein GSVR_27210 [Geobacter sp. SVR]GCF87644.1 hypothetical protein GSbR_42440 [Geobacter sp. SVR]